MQTQLFSNLAGRSLSAPAGSFARSISNQDNSFRTARNLGVLSPSSGRKTFRASGILGRGDRADVVKFTIRTGTSSSGGNGNFRIQNGSIRYSLFRDFAGSGIQRVGGFVAGQGSNPLVISAFPATSARTTFYIVLDRPTQNPRYSLSFTYNP